MLVISDKAKEKLLETVQEKGGNLFVRIFVEGFGWGGPRLGLTLEESSHNDDLVVEEEGIKFIYTSMVERYIPGMQIDFVPGKFGGFLLKPAGLGGC